jgi:5-methylcytosine-specific restriction endonuclease McrA
MKVELHQIPGMPGILIIPMIGSCNVIRLSPTKFGVKIMQPRESGEFSKKQCNTCKIYRPRESFHRNNRMIDGLQAKCVDCCHEYKLARREGKDVSVVPVEPERFFIPDIYLVGYGRSQMYQHCCLKCSREFFCLLENKDLCDLFCDACVPNEDLLKPSNVSSIRFVGNIVGWIIKSQGAGKKRIQGNYKKTYERDRYACQYCGYNLADAKKFFPLHIDHIRPWSSAGGNAMDNLVVACQPCNLAASDKWFTNFEEKKQFILDVRKKGSHGR